MYKIKQLSFLNKEPQQTTAFTWPR